MQNSERNRLGKLQTALLLAASDFDQAAAAARALDSERENLALMRALETAIAVCYSRAFTQSTLLKLCSEFVPPAGTADAELHEVLMAARNKLYAHTDRAGGRSTTTSVATHPSEETAGLVEWREEWLPFPRGYIPEVLDLCSRLAERFRGQAAAIQVLLDAEAAS
jgi:hypothetical protein